MTTDKAVQKKGYRIMTFSPSKDEFQDFSQYIAYMESLGAHKAGIAKVSSVGFFVYCEPLLLST